MPRRKRQIPFTRSEINLTDYRTALEDVLDSVLTKNGVVVEVRVDSTNSAIGIIVVEEDI